MYNKTLLAVVVATGIAMFIISGSFHDIYGRKLSYLTNSATASINSTSVGRSIEGVSNSDPIAPLHSWNLDNIQYK